MSFISSFEIINVFIPDPNIFLWIATSVADAAAVIPNGIGTLLANGLSTFPIKGNPVVRNGTKSLPKILLDCLILCNWVFDSFILAEELFAEALQSLETCVLVDNNLSRKLFPLLELPKTFDEIFKVTSVPFLNPDYIFLIWELDNLIVFKVQSVIYWVILYWCQIKSQ